MSLFISQGKKFIVNVHWFPHSNHISTFRLVFLLHFISFIWYVVYVDFCINTIQLNWILIGILVTASQDESNNYHYNTICVVLITEFVKLIASTVLYCKRFVWFLVKFSIFKANETGVSSDIRFTLINIFCVLIILAIPLVRWSKKALTTNICYCCISYHHFYTASITI